MSTTKLVAIHCGSAIKAHGVAVSSTPTLARWHGYEVPYHRVIARQWLVNGSIAPPSERLSAEQLLAHVDVVDPLPIPRPWPGQVCAVIDEPAWTGLVMVDAVEEEQNQVFVDWSDGTRTEVRAGQSWMRGPLVGGSGAPWSDR